MLCWRSRTYQQLWTVKAHTTKNLHGLLDKTNMKDWFDQIDVAKVSWAFVHVARTCLASWGSVNDTLTRVHEATQLWLAPFIDLRVFDATFGHRHTSNLIWRQDSKLHPFDWPNGGFWIWAKRAHGGCNPALKRNNSLQFFTSSTCIDENA